MQDDEAGGAAAGAGTGDDAVTRAALALVGDDGAAWVAGLGAGTCASRSAIFVESCRWSSACPVAGDRTRSKRAARPLVSGVRAFVMAGLT